jgi:hypothetical protein
MSAGEPLNPEVIRAWKKAFGLEIYDFMDRRKPSVSYPISLYEN